MGGPERKPSESPIYCSTVTKWRLSQEVPPRVLGWFAGASLHANQPSSAWSGRWPNCKLGSPAWWEWWWANLQETLSWLRLVGEGEWESWHVMLNSISHCNLCGKQLICKSYVPRTQSCPLAKLYNMVAVWNRLTLHFHIWLQSPMDDNWPQKKISISITGYRLTNAGSRASSDARVWNINQRMLTVTLVRYTYIHSRFVLHTTYMYMHVSVVLFTRSIVAFVIPENGLHFLGCRNAHASLQRDLPEFAIHFTWQSRTMQLHKCTIALVLPINVLSQCPHTLPRTITHVPCRH